LFDLAQLIAHDHLDHNPLILQFGKKKKKKITHYQSTINIGNYTVGAHDCEKINKHLILNPAHIIWEPRLKTLKTVCFFPSIQFKVQNTYQKEKS
jgi:hypothetical protein